ncbi:conserved protein, unknown function, partial [Hepatocystis sp. ex Piliocolobus tephrosceles]
YVNLDCQRKEKLFMNENINFFTCNIYKKLFLIYDCFKLNIYKNNDHLTTQNMQTKTQLIQKKNVNTVNTTTLVTTNNNNNMATITTVVNNTNKRIKKKTKEKKNYKSLCILSKHTNIRNYLINVNIVDDYSTDINIYKQLYSFYINAKCNNYMNELIKKEFVFFNGKGDITDVIRNVLFFKQINKKHKYTFINEIKQTNAFNHKRLDNYATNQVYNKTMYHNNNENEIEDYKNRTKTNEYCNNNWMLYTTKNNDSYEANYSSTVNEKKGIEQRGFTNFIDNNNNLMVNPVSYNSQNKQNINTKFVKNGIIIRDSDLTDKICYKTDNGTVGHVFGDKTSENITNDINDLSLKMFQNIFVLLCTDNHDNKKEMLSVDYTKDNYKFHLNNKIISKMDNQVLYNNDKANVDYKALISDIKNYILTDSVKINTNVECAKLIKKLIKIKNDYIRVKDYYLEKNNINVRSLGECDKVMLLEKIIKTYYFFLGLNS